MCFPESYPDVNTQHGHISLKRFDTPIQEENRILSGGLVALNKRDTETLVIIHQNLAIQTEQTPNL